MRHFTNGIRFVVVVVAALGATSPARTSRADGSPADVAAARTIGTEGLQLAESGDCKSAVEKLEKAERLHHAPTILERWGECQITLGKIVAGTEALQRVVNESLPAGASGAFVKAQERARAALKAALPKIAKLRISVKGAPPDVELEVSVDGEPVPRVLLDGERATDPGTRTIVASARGYSKDTRSIIVNDGESAAVVLTLKKTEEAAPPPVSVVPPPPVPPSAPAQPDAPPPAKSRVLPFVLLGVGAAGIATGTVFGLTASSKKSSLDSACVDKHCPATSQSDIDSMKSATTISTVGFAAGAGAAGAGVYFLLDRRDATPSTGSGVGLHPYVGLGVAGVRGTF